MYQIVGIFMSGEIKFIGQPIKAGEAQYWVKQLVFLFPGAYFNLREIHE